MPDMKPVFSSYVDKIGYDDETHELWVEYRRGRPSVYDGVPESVANSVMGSASIGTALHSFVRGVYPHRYV